MKKLSNTVFAFVVGAMTVMGMTTAASVRAQDTPLPPTMGWSSWNTFAAKISEDIIKGQAQAMVDKGFADVGYNYLNIDDGYFENRDPETGKLIIHKTRFPNGMRPVVDFIHSLGLKAGCYSDAGHNTCASYWEGETGGIGGGMYEHDMQDCDMYFNEFDFDFIKVDFCGGVAYHNNEGLDLDPRERYTAIRKAIDECGHPEVVLNACRWDYPGTWISEVANSWRVTQDIWADWSSVKDIIHQSLYLSPYCSPGHYNDMDMLEVGRNLTADEDVTHFGIWCIMSSPLLIGCDMTTISDRVHDVLTNVELIALNQDSLGLQAYVAKKTDEGAYILVKDFMYLYGTSRAVALYNPTDKEVEVTLDFTDVDLDGDVMVRDLVEHTDLGTMQGSYTTTLRKHASRFLMLGGERRLMRTLYEGEHGYIPAYQELVNNQYAQTGIYVDKNEAHNGAVAGWLGCSEENCLQWRDVVVPEDGEYEMTVYYISGENREITIDVNGEVSVEKNLNSGGWNVVGSFTRKVNLKAGANFISLSNPNSWMPDIDYMTIKASGAGLSTTIADKPFNNDTRVIDLQGRVAGDISNTSNLTPGVYIVGGRKTLLP